MSTIKVAAEKCSSCIFSPNSPISPERFADLRSQWGEHGHQICHAFGVGDGDGGLDGEDVWCRGFYDASPSLQGPWP